MNRGYDYKKFAILFVDDEEKALKYFEKAYSEDFRVITASSAAKAWEIIERTGDTIGVIISDQRMPGETGVDLLTRVRASRPGIVRILTTAFSELNNAIDAVNTGAVFRYITKPWDIRALQGDLRTAMEFFLVQRERDILLREKLSVLQRMITFDRVRSFTVLAASMACRVRNSMTALQAFFDLAPVVSDDDDDKDNVNWSDLWTMAQDESQNMVDAVDQVVGSTLDADYAFADRVDVAQAIQAVVDQAKSDLDARGASVSVQADGDLPQVHADDSMLRRLLQILLLRIATIATEGPKITVTVKREPDVFGVQGVRVTLQDESEQWTDKQLGAMFAALKPTVRSAQSMGMDLLAAFFITHHHGGLLNIHTTKPQGPGFDLVLPSEPDNVKRPPLEADWLDRIFMNLEAWESVGEPR